MNENNGRIWYSTWLDNSKLKQGAKETSAIFKGIGETAETESARIDSAFNKIAGSAAMIFGGISVVSFIKDIASVRGEFQKLEIAFETMLKSKEKATALMNQMMVTAAKTPFDLQSVASGAKQLLAYGIAAEEVNETLVRLGDVASGLSIPLGDLVYLYGTTKVQGRLFAQDVRQFMGRGIPLANELASELGKTTEEITEMVTSGKIGFPEVEKVLLKLTNEGGQFYNLMEKQSSSITGQISNLQDKWQVMLNEIGTRSEGVFTSAISFASDLVENYEEIGRVIATLVVTYGSYKAAVITLTAVQRVNIQMQLQAALAGKTLTSAQAFQAVVVSNLTKLWRALNKTALANPYVAVTVAVVGLVSAMWALHDRTTDAEKAQRDYNDYIEKTKEKKDALISTTNELINKIRDENQTIYAQIAAWKELQKAIPEAFKNISIEEFKKLDSKEIKARINKVADEREQSDIIKKYEDAQKKAANIEEKLRQETEKHIYRPGDLHIIRLESLRDKLKIANEELKVAEKGHRDLMQARKEAEFSAKPDSEKLQMLSAELSVLKKQREETEQILINSEKTENAWGGFLEKARFEAALNYLNNKIKETQGRISAIGGTESVSETKNKKYWEDRKKEAESTIEGIDADIKKKLDDGVRSGIDASIVTSFEAAKKNLKEAEDKLKAYQSKKDASAQDRDKVSDSVSKLVSDINQERIEAQFESDQALIDAMEDGVEKEIAQIQLNHKKRIHEIERTYDEQKKKVEELKKEWVKNGGKEKDFVSPLGDIERVRDMKIDNADTQRDQQINRHYDNLLDKYKDFEQRRLDIQRKFAEERTVIESGPYSDAKKQSMLVELEKQLHAALEALREEELNALKKDSVLLTRVFSDASEMSKRRLKEVLDSTRQLVAYLSKASDVIPDGISPEVIDKLNQSPKELKEIYDQLIALQKEYDDRTKYPFSGFITGLDKLREARKKAQEALSEKDPVKKVAIEHEADRLKQSGINDIESGAYEAADAVSNLSEKLKELAELSGDGQFKNFAEQMGALSQTVSAVAKGAQSGGAIGAVIAGVTDILSQTIEAFVVARLEAEEFQRNQLDFANEYAIALLKIKDIDYESVFGEKSFSKAAKAAELAKKSMQSYKDEIAKRSLPQRGSDLGETMTNIKAYLKGYSDLEGMAVKIKDHSGWANFLGIKDKYASLKDIAPDIFEGGEFNVEAAKIFLETNTQINDTQRKQIQNVIDLKETYDENMAIIREDIKDTFGELGDSAVNSVVEAIKEGTDAWEAFGDAGTRVIEKLGEKLMYEIFFADAFDDFQKRLEDSYKEGGDAEDILNRQMQIMSELFPMIEARAEAAEAWGEMFKEIAKESGFDDVFGSEREGLSKGITSVSQDSFNEYLGRITNIQDHTFHIKNDIAAIMGQNATLVANSSVILDHLAGIRKNTEPISEMRDDIKQLRSGMEDTSEHLRSIRDRGIMIKTP